MNRGRRGRASPVEESGGLADKKMLCPAER